MWNYPSNAIEILFFRLHKAHMEFNVSVAYLALKSTRFLRCVLCPGESLHVFSAVLTCLQVRLENTLSDALCGKQTQADNNQFFYVMSVMAAGWGETQLYALHQDGAVTALLLLHYISESTSFPFSALLIPTIHHIYSLLPLKVCAVFKASLHFGVASNHKNVK